MIPGNVDPRRPEKVQRYKPPQSNGNAPVEDLTPDYMNILGPDSATANADAADNVKQQPHPQQQQPEDPPASSASIQDTTVAQTSANGTNVIPTSPQYGVAIMNSNSDVPQEVITSSTDTVVETTAKSEENKEGNMHSTPSRNDRFKVVKIASLEPFRRGRWKCMDYVDENPPPVSGANAVGVNKVGISGGGGGGALYMQTQSLPQQHFQQMLVQQGVFANQPQFYQNVPAQMLPQNQYFYQAPATVASMQQIGVQQGGIQQQFINANQQYFQQNVVPHSAGYNYSNVQYVPTANLIQNQSSAFVPTTQNVNPQLPPNFQQSQTYAGPPSGNQPLVNGHAFPQNPTEPAQVVASSLPTQVAKNVILNANVPPSQQQQQQQQTLQPNLVPPNNNIQSQVSVLPNQQFTTNYQPVGAQATSVIPSTQNPVNYDVYTNPQFVASVVNNSNTNTPVVSENNPSSTSEDPAGGDSNSQENSETATGDDPAKANPVVNAIDNKIEQAMDLVKSHLMYTVREEVEVLKEKIAELMERIQQLETENNFLKQQIPKGLNSNPSGTPDPPQ